MNRFGDYLYTLRREKRMTQAELADLLGITNKAVSKWESEQSTTKLEKIIILSEFFEVTTDYILKGIEPTKDKDEKGKEIISRILYISSTAFIAIGLFCAFGGWYAEQTMETVWGAMIIQAVGIAGYFIGRLLSTAKVPFYIDWLNIVGIAFMPVSMITGYLSILISKQGWIAPYPSGIFHVLIFGIVFLTICIISYILLRKRTHDSL